MIRLLNALAQRGAHAASVVRKLIEEDGPGPQTDRGVAKGLCAIACAPDWPIEEIHEGSGNGEKGIPCVRWPSGVPSCFSKRCCTRWLEG